MSIGIGNPIYDLANLPGQGKSSGGGGAPTVDLINNDYSFKFDSAANSSIQTNIGNIYNHNDKTLSFSCWFNIPAAIPGTNLYSYLVIWSSNDSPDLTSGPGANMRLYQAAPGDFKAYLYGYNGPSGGQSGGYSKPLYYNVWYNIVTVWTGMNVLGTNRNKVELYIDGELEITKFNTISSANNSYLNEPRIGGKYSSYFNAGAYIDEWAYWENTGLSEDDIKLIYNSTNDNPGKTANLDTLSTGAPTAWYRMGD